MTDIKKMLKGSTSLGPIGGAFADDGDKNDNISDSDKKMDKLMDMIGDACTKLDAVGPRMDAMEENFRRVDSRMDAMSKVDADDEKKEEERKDADDEKSEEKSEEKRESAEEKKAEAKEVAADKRKDSEDEKSEDRKDARRKDEGEGEDEGDKREDAMADDAPMSRAEAAALRADLASLRGQMPAILSDADRERYATIQAQAEPAYQAFGDQAPAPLAGETHMQYKKRLGTVMQANSAKWKDTRLGGIADEATIDVILADVYADSITAARRGADVPDGELRPKSTRTPAGHTIVTYDGRPQAWMGRHKGAVSRAGRRA